MQVQSVFEEAQNQARVLDSAAAIALALCASCGLRLLTASEQAVSSWSLVVGILLGNLVTTGIVALNMRRQKGRTTRRGWCTAALCLSVAALVLSALWGLVHGDDDEALPFGSPVGWLTAGSALSLVQGVGLVGALVACLQRNGNRMWLALGACATLVILAAALASPSWRLGHFYATLLSVSMLSFGLLLGPVAAMWMSVARWGISLENGPLLSD